MVRNRNQAVVRRTRRYHSYNPGLGNAVRMLGPHVLKSIGDYVTGKRTRDGSRIPSYTRATSARRGVRPIRNVTRGFRVKKFNKKRKITRDPFKLYGSVKITEKGNTVTPAVIGAIGHSNVALYEVLESVTRALWRALMRKHGVVFTDWANTFEAQGTFDFRMEYRKDPAGATIVVNGPAYIGTQTHLWWANRLTSVIMDAYASTDDQLIINKLYCYDGNFRICEMDVTNATLHLKLESDMVIQNRTRGETLGDDLVTDVTNNPIEGRSWTVTGNGMQPLANRQMSLEAIAHHTHATIGGSMNVTSDGAGTTFKPNDPQTYKFGLGSSKQKIMSGEIARSKLFSVYKMSLQQFCLKYKAYIGLNTAAAATNLVRIPLGKSRMFVFEKVCDTGAGDQLVSLGYEINNKVSSYITVKLPYSNLIAEKF